MPATMIVLRHDEYEATVDPVGAALHTLTVRGRDLVLGLDAAPPLPAYRGAVLAPWPNRIGDGRYEFGGRVHQLPITEPARGCALHGLVLWHDWTVARADVASAVLTTTIRPQPGYPFTVDVEARYAVSAAGLRIEVRGTNAGPDAAPWATSIHPYLVAGPGPVDDWTLQVPAESVVEVDDRLLPTGTTPVDGTRFDFRSGRRIGADRLDHALAEVRFDADGRATATVTAADGAGVRMEWDQACRWVQVHTTDTDDPRTDRRGLAFEPMTAPPDAFASGTGVTELAPGRSAAAGWVIGGL